MDLCEPHPQEGAAGPDSSPGSPLHGATVHERHPGRAAHDLHSTPHVSSLCLAGVSTASSTLGAVTGLTDGPGAGGPPV